MSDNGSEGRRDRARLTHKAYVKLWGSLQGALHPYVKDLMPLVERSLLDPDFRRELIERSDQVFEREGVAFADGVRVEVVEDTQETRYLVLPPMVESIPAARMDVFNSMLTSGTLNQWGQDDSNYADGKRPGGPEMDSNVSDPGVDDWHPF